MYSTKYMTCYGWGRAVIMLITVASSKEKMVNVRLSPVVHEQFKIACELRGVSMSSILHQFIVRTIREERELEPKAFRREATDSHILPGEISNAKRPQAIRKKK